MALDPHGQAGAYNNHAKTHSKITINLPQLIGGATPITSKATHLRNQHLKPRYNEHHKRVSLFMLT
jgi:hypothetical protein